MAEEPDETPIDPSPPPPVPRRKRRLGRLFFYGFLTLWLLTALWNLYKPLPEGVSVRGEIVETPLNQLQFLHDVTGADVFGAPVVRQQIFDAVLALIGEAREYLVLDFFLFNGQRGAALDAQAASRAVGRAARRAAGAQARDAADCTSWCIADPINDVYGGLPSRDLAALRDAGIEVVTVDLDSLRDSNPIYSVLLAADHELVVGRRLGRGQPSESARRRARTGELRRVGAAAQFQGQPPQGDHRRRRQRRNHRDRHLRQSARCQQPALQRRR